MEEETPQTERPISPDEQRAQELRATFEYQFSELCGQGRYREVDEFQGIINRTIAQTLLDKKCAQLAERDGKVFNELAVQDQITYLSRLESDLRNLHALESGAYGGTRKWIRGGGTQSPIVAYLQGQGSEELKAEIGRRGNIAEITRSNLIGDVVFLRQLLSGSSSVYGTADNWRFMASLAVAEPRESSPVYAGETAEKEKVFLTDHAEELALILEGADFANNPRVQALVSGELFHGQAQKGRWTHATPYDQIREVLDEAGVDVAQYAEQTTALRDALETALEKLRERKVSDALLRIEAIELMQDLPKLQREIEEVTLDLERVTGELQRVGAEHEEQERVIAEAGVLQFRIKGMARTELESCRNQMIALTEERETLSVWLEALKQHEGDSLHRRRENYHTERVPTNPDEVAADLVKLQQERERLESIGL